MAKSIYFGIQALRGEPVRHALEDVRRTEFMSSDELRSVQASRQLEQLRFAVNHVPHYQQAYSGYRTAIEKADGWDDVNAIMGELPFITKDDVRVAPDRFTAANAEQYRSYPDKTSGSTGTPLVFPCDQISWAYRHALTFRCMESFAVGIGERYVYFWGLHWKRASRFQAWLRDSILNRIRVNAFHIEKAYVESYCKQIRRWKPACFWGYPSALHDFCMLASELGQELTGLGVKAIFTTGEPLYPHQRKVIEDVTGARCVNTYGSAEGGFMAFECPAGSMHLTPEATWLQLSERNEREGQVIITDFMLRSFPMIRYALGDEVSLNYGVCSCGRAQPVLDSVIGRHVAPIVLSNGKKVDDQLLSYIFKPLASLGVIRKYRFVEYAGGYMDLLLVISGNFQSNHKSQIEGEIRGVLGNDLKFEIKIVENFPEMESAKYRSYIRVE